MGLRNKIRLLIIKELLKTKDKWDRCVNHPRDQDFSIEVDDLGVKCPECNRHVDPVSAWLHDHDIVQVLEGLIDVVLVKDWLTEHKKKKLIKCINYINKFCCDNIEKG